MGLILAAREEETPWNGVSCFGQKQYSTGRPHYDTVIVNGEGGV